MQTVTTPPPADTTLKVGDAVTHTTYTDAKAAEIIKVSPNGKTVLVRYCNQELLNGCNSGHPEALVCHPGGFCGHVEGRQIWKVTSDPAGATAKFSLRKVGPYWRWKMAGTTAASQGNTLKAGHRPHYDFNF